MNVFFRVFPWDFVAHFTGSEQRIKNICKTQVLANLDPWFETAGSWGFLESLTYQWFLCLGSELQYASTSLTTLLFRDGPLFFPSLFCPSLSFCIPLSAPMFSELALRKLRTLQKKWFLLFGLQASGSFKPVTPQHSLFTAPLLPLLQLLWAPLTEIAMLFRYK